MFNALKYIKSLEGVGFPREQAEAQVQLVIDSFQENVATKSDLAELKAELKSEIADLRADFTELRADFTELRADFTELRAEFASKIAETKTDLVFRLGGIVVLCTGVLGVLISVLTKF